MGRVVGEAVPEDDTFSIGVTRAHDGICVIGVRGALDMLTASFLARRFQQELTTEGCRALVLNLSGVGFMGSAGLATLVEARKLAGDTIQVVFAGGLSDAVTRSLELAGLRELFPAYPTLAQALAALLSNR